MKIQATGIAIAFLVSSNAVFADMPPPWSEFDARSSNGQYLVEVRVQDRQEGLSPSDQKYQLTVFDIQQHPRQFLWLCAYDYDGYPGGFLSDDGSTFVYVNFWYYQDSPVVSIYRHGKRSRFLFGRDFNIRKSKLKTTVSHQVWLDDSTSSNIRFVQTNALLLGVEITAIDQKIHLIDVESGEFVKP